MELLDSHRLRREQLRNLRIYLVRQFQNLPLVEARPTGASCGGLHHMRLQSLNLKDMEKNLLLTAKARRKSTRKNLRMESLALLLRIRMITSSGASDGCSWPNIQLFGGLNGSTCKLSTSA